MIEVRRRRAKTQDGKQAANAEQDAGAEATTTMTTTMVQKSEVTEDKRDKVRDTIYKSRKICPLDS